MSTENEKINMERAKRLIFGAPADEPELVYGYVRISEDNEPDGIEMKEHWEEYNIVEQVMISIMPKEDVECWGTGEMIFQWRKNKAGDVFCEFDMSQESFGAFTRVAEMMNVIFETFDLNPTPESLVDSLAIHGFENLLDPPALHFQNQDGLEIDILHVNMNDEICAITIDNFSVNPVTIQNYNIEQLIVNENWENIYDKPLQKFESYQEALDEFSEDPVIHYKILNVCRERGYVEY